MESPPNFNYRIKHWEKHFYDHGIREDLIQAYLPYVKKFLAKKLPVIFENQHLALLLGRSNQFVVSIINANESFYREFKIPKRRGGERQISAPMPSLLECQYWIKKNILDQFTPHDSTHGFRSDRSILTNAQVHLKNQSVLKIDIEDFFPSIKINRVINFFQNLGYTKDISFTLSKFCTLYDCLPQGAPTSPILSNLLNYKLDVRLNALAKKFNFCYSRYADDLTFSSKKIPFKFISYVENILNEENYFLNPNKTLLKDSGKRIITGVSISNNKISLPRNYKRNLRQELYYIKKFGYFGHAKSQGIRDPYYPSKILGKISYWLFIEPENTEALEYKEMMISLIKNLD
jgi:retron-type reverse transcriptase